ncbi:MAG TPA: aldose 1-epimerase [Thermoanaerobaculia bacterium]|nr:aldose 1-epimerase [Thermoanaerobaculia bacterium]
MPRHDSNPVSNEPIVTLRSPAPPAPDRPAFLSAQILPHRGMMTLQVTAHLPSQGEFDLLAPSTQEALEVLHAPPGDFPGNPTYLVGGGILLPYANRIRGTVCADGKSLLTNVLGKAVHLPANTSGRQPGAERVAMHGLMLDARMDEVRRETTGENDRLHALLHAGDFGGSWLSATDVEIENVLTGESFTLTVTARNVGGEPLPMGIGWHPYFALPSGRREQARLHLPARQRARVNNYDDVLPTGELVPVAGTPYDFGVPGGRALGDLYLDDCFVDLVRSPDGHVAAEIVDPAGAYGLRVISTAPPVRAFQVYAPPQKGLVVIEPQLNWADPFGPQWGPGTDTGMVVLEPGESAVYSARLELFTPQAPSSGP